MASLIQVDKSISAMYKKLQKNLTSEELLPSLWDKCKVNCIFFSKARSGLSILRLFCEFFGIMIDRYLDVSKI